MKNISLKTKILLLSGFMTMVAVAIGTTSYIYLNKTESAFRNVVDVDVPAIHQLNRMLLTFRYARIELLQVILPDTTAEADAESLKIIQEQWNDFDTDEKQFSATINTPEEKELYKEFKTSIEEVRGDFRKAIALYNKDANADSSTDSKDRKEMVRIVTFDIAKHGIAVRDYTKKLISLQTASIDSDTKLASKSAKDANLIVLFATLIGSLLGLSFAILFSTKVSRQIANIINTISESSNQVAEASTQIASSSQELSQAATEQAASLEETAASLEEISAMISKASESATTTETSSNESQQKAEEGRKAVEQMMTSMDEISHSNDEIMNQVNHSNQQMSEIVRVIQEIGNKTKVINEIVFQTKLLSFNASVEAARAGEHGKGFAVVAEEVGNLAQMSGNSAKEITEMLDGSIAKVEAIVHESKSKVESLVKKGKEKVESGVEVARQCSSVLEEIVTNVTRVTGLAQEISQASKEQSQGVGEINKAMSQLDSVTQQNSAASEQTASSAEQLSTQAISLKSAVDDLVVTVQGGVTKNHPGFSKAQNEPSKSFKNKTPANIIPLKSAKKAKTAPISPSYSKEYKVASGDSITPSRDSDGFDDV